MIVDVVLKDHKLSNCTILHVWSNCIESPFNKVVRFLANIASFKILQKRNKKNLIFPRFFKEVCKK